MDRRTRLLLEAPIGPTLLRLGLPNVVVMVVQASIGLIETAFVARLGTDALAGMSLVFPVLMQVQMMSAGAMGGGMLSAVSRTLGAGRREEANGLVWHALALAVGLGLLTTALLLPFGRALYTAMGGEGAALAAALTYSHLIFAGAVLAWTFNALAAVIRGTGNMALPAAVTAVGAVVLIPLSPMLIFGWAGLPALGIAGGAWAVLLYYAAGSAVFAAYLWSGRGVLRPAARPPRLRWAPMREILRVGAVATLVTLTTNITMMVATAQVAAHGPAAVAGYGTGARLEYLMVPLAFGLGAPIAAMVGTAVGAGRRQRALRAAWTGAAVVTVATGAIGLAAALWPQAWLGLFGDAPDMLAYGSRYLRLVGPFYGFFGLGMALYFASQGAGRLAWPLAGGLLRLLVAAGGGLLAMRLGFGIDGVFLALGLGLVAVGTVNAAAVAAGVWFRDRPARMLAPAAMPAGRAAE
ncbi:MATE family efflux transporter [Roseomonas sp. NAR14]|uniref:MATE family efflux transporter n=1 Tax=Roseomonas acroporae TaxID=2937791 RepID=A0A9X1Y4J7_9PROT|nr:MATE family efflux transporter [Roseomonas acroporae]MCK8782920.1 MATE family efflux transporter [Roseomonas acroporae]